MTPFRYIDVLQTNDECTDIDWEKTDAAIDAHFEAEHEHLTKSQLSTQKELSKSATRTAWKRIVDVDGYNAAVALLVKMKCKS